MTQKSFVFDIGPNQHDSDSFNQLHGVISAYFPPGEFSTPLISDKSYSQTFYSGRKFWMLDDLYARVFSNYGISSTIYQIDLTYLNESIELPHEESKTLNDFISEIESLEPFIETRDII